MDFHENGRGSALPFSLSAQCDRAAACGYNGLSMIAHLCGKLLTKHPNQVVVETCGVGYEVNISVPTFSELPASGSEIALHIHTHAVSYTHLGMPRDSVAEMGQSIGEEYAPEKIR